jgi:hypothetical protein
MVVIVRMKIIFTNHSEVENMRTFDEDFLHCAEVKLSSPLIGLIISSNKYFSLIHKINTLLSNKSNVLLQLY